MASKGGMGSGSVLAVEQSMKERGIMGFRMDMEQKHTQMEVRFYKTFVFVVQKKQVEEVLRTFT